MAKTNFSKVDAQIEKELDQRQIERLIKSTQIEQEEKELQPKAYLIIAIKRDLKLLKGHSRKLTKIIGISGKEIKSLLTKPQDLKEEDWQLLSEIKEKLNKFKKKISEELEGKQDDELVDQEKEKHINKRFNVNDKWLPLH